MTANARIDREDGLPVWKLYANGIHVDTFRAIKPCMCASRELANGSAHIEPHRPVGCRVQPGAPR